VESGALACLVHSLIMHVRFCLLRKGSAFRIRMLGFASCHDWLFLADPTSGCQRPWHRCFHAGSHWPSTKRCHIVSPPRPPGNFYARSRSVPLPGCRLAGLLGHCALCNYRVRRQVDLVFGLALHQKISVPALSRLPSRVLGGKSATPDSNSPTNAVCESDALQVMGRLKLGYTKSRTGCVRCKARRVKVCPIPRPGRIVPRRDPDSADPRSAMRTGHVGHACAMASNAALYLRQPQPGRAKAKALRHPHFKSNRSRTRRG